MFSSVSIFALGVPLLKCGMFVRKKSNKSGTTSIQIVDKSGGSYRVVHSVGSSADPAKIEKLLSQAHAKLDSMLHANQLRLFPSVTQSDGVIKDFLESLSNGNIRTAGPELIFGALFDRIGFNAIPDQIFRQLVLTRLVCPTSKLQTVDYLYRYMGDLLTEDAVYKFLDRFAARHKAQAEEIAFMHTQKTIKNVSVAFYDMTTLYFEAEQEDDLRKIGFSKDGKFRKPQIMLGLLVAEYGYPIGYSIFEGNKFEGHTLLPVLQEMQDRFNLDKPVVVADAAMLTERNLSMLADNGYQFIIGGRIKNESSKIQATILKKSKGIKNGDSFAIRKANGHRLIVTYSDKRAKKDAYNRERGLKRLRQRLKTNKLTKKNINNRGYNKFLAIEGNLRVTINEQKVIDDQKWDGLKGYVTTTRLRRETVVENYGQLWRIEKAFRISKHDLKIRPVYHYKRERIEAHICIAFAAYTIWKELERLLQKAQAEMSPTRAAELTRNMYAIEFQLPNSKTTEKHVLKMDPEQKILWNAVYGP